MIDDDQAIREVLKQLIEDAGFESIEATDGVEGLQKVREKSCGRTDESELPNVPLTYN